MSKRPQTGEFAAYYNTYISKVAGEDVLAVLAQSHQEVLALLQSLPADKWDYRYGPDKWTIKEVLLHLIDAERIFTYRGLRIGRGDTAALAGFDQDEYVPFSNPAGRSPESIIEEYQTVRAASISLYKNLRPEDLQRMGTASGHPTSCRATAFMMAGHERHHLQIIKERYL